VFINIDLGWTEDRTDANISAEQLAELYHLTRSRSPAITDNPAWSLWNQPAVYLNIYRVAQKS